MDYKPKIIVVIGATASQKTKVAVDIATKYDGEVINADSFQVYRELKIGTARPSKKEKKNIKFHLDGSISIFDKWDIKRFQDKAILIIKDILKRGKLPIVVGGSMLYIDVLVRNYYLKESFERNNTFENFTNLELFKMIKKTHKKKAEDIGINNRNRLIRAMQIISNNISFKKTDKKLFKPIFIYCQYPTREMLYNQINERVERMIACGWAKEVITVLEKFGDKIIKLNALKAIGYNEIIFSIKNSCGINVEKIKRDVRHYAKRQLTWIRNHNYRGYISYDVSKNDIDLLYKKIKCRL